MLRKRELIRKSKLLPHRLYIYISNKDIEFLNDPFVRQFTNRVHDHYNIYNIYGLKHKDLFKAVYVKLMSDPEVLAQLNKYSLSLIGTSFRDLETGFAMVYDIHPFLNINKHISFNEFYSSILSYYCHIEPKEDLDYIYRLEVRMMKK